MAAADVLFMPSHYESLSMVALEAWALGRPVLANGKCDVLKGQCIRSNAGLYYENASEFFAALRAIEQNRWLAGTLGRNGRAFFREQYDWAVIERKYLEMFDRLKQEPPRPIEPPPGWLDRRRQDLPAAQDTLAKLPTGPTTIASREPDGRSGPATPKPAGETDGRSGPATPKPAGDANGRRRA